MSILRLIGTAAILIVLGAAPALAQQVIQEPGYCAFFYPNANCQNKGPGNPYTDPNLPAQPFRHRRRLWRCDGWRCRRSGACASRPGMY